MTEQIVFTKTYEDKRTHRSGKLLEYNEKYKTYLLESSDGKTFNVTSSQFKINWRMIEESEVQAEIKPEQPEKVVSKPKKAVVQKRKSVDSKELNQTYTDTTLALSKYAGSFQNDLIAVALMPHKRICKFKVDYNILFELQVLLRSDRFRLWVKDNIFDRLIADCSIEPVATKQFNCPGRNYTADYNLSDLEAVLDDVRTIVLDAIVKVQGGI